MFNLTKIIEEKSKENKYGINNNLNNQNSGNNNLNNQNSGNNNLNNQNSGNNNLNNQNSNISYSKSNINSYIEIPKNEWNILPKKTYIRYILIGNEELKHGGMISDIINESGNETFVLYSKIGNYWKSWKLKFNTINKLYKLNKQSGKNISQSPLLNQQQLNQQPLIQQFTPYNNQQQPLIQQFTPYNNQQSLINNNQLNNQQNNPISIFQKTDISQGFENLLACQPIQLPNLNNDNKSYKTEIELLNKKIENLEITQQRLESDIKKIVNILNKLSTR
jgi:hypothetical protein